MDGRFQIGAGSRPHSDRNRRTTFDWNTHAGRFENGTPGLQLIGIAGRFRLERVAGLVWNSHFMMKRFETPSRASV